MDSKWMRLGRVLLIAGFLSLSPELAASAGASEAGSAVVQKDEGSVPPGEKVEGAAEDPPMVMGRPGSIESRLERDRIPKEYLFQFPGVSRLMKPWYELKNDLDKNHGFRFGISYTALY